jgi:coiled-coil domain-containing protein 77
LLSYYRSKIGEFDKERMEWLAKIEEIRISHEDKHRLEWELLKRKEEIAELQRTLSESKLMLFEERQLCLKLQRDNDQLKLKELEDRKRIQELLIMTGSVEEQVVLQRDVRPQTT